MIINVNFDNIKLIEEIQIKFSDVFQQENELKNEFMNNPFTKLYAFLENSDIIGIIHINDIYDRYEINNIFVLEEHRNKKVASKLLNSIINIAIENKKINITLEVRKDNIAAINLYKKHGFIEKAIRKGYYKGTDGILMEKEMM